MNHFDYRNGVLHAEAVNLIELAEAVGTPFYCYSTATLERHYRVFSEAFAGEKAVVCYAMKANSNQSVLRTLAKLGAGADVVSGGELKRALAAGIPPQKILFSGVGKTEAELRAALAADILVHQCRVRARTRIAVAARGRGRQDRADLGAGQSRRRRRHPRQDRHRQVREQVRRPDRARPRRLCPRGQAAGDRGHRHRHAYRQPDHRSLPKMETAFRILAEFVQTLRADGHTISHIDFGGGLGIPYYMDRAAPPAPDAYAAMVKRVTHNLGCTLMFEPGRMIVGNAGILVTRVIYVKPGDAKNFVIIDAAMNDLIRPTLYEAHHDILPVREPAQGHAHRSSPTWSGRSAKPATISRSTASLPEPKAGDLLAIMTAGAYGAVQSGTYNTRALVPEVLVKDDQYAVVRPRIEVEELIAMDRASAVAVTRCAVLAKPGPITPGIVVKNVCAVALSIGHGVWVPARRPGRRRSVIQFISPRRRPWRRPPSRPPPFRSA